MQRYNIFPNQPNYKCFIDNLKGNITIESTIVEIINVLQTPLRFGVSFLSTIVEIISVLQTKNKSGLVSQIYNSRNYKCLIDFFLSNTYRRESTIVEITNVLQTVNYRVCPRHLQQQKLQMFYRQDKRSGGRL